MNTLTITPSDTPNPNARKFTLNRPVGATMLNLGSAAQAAAHPVAAALFTLPGITNVFLTGNFITVNKDSEPDWNTLEPSITVIIQTHYND